MSHLDRALEWLRPLVLDSDNWDYCVIWKLGDDPTRFIEWMGCCCNGSKNQDLKKRKKVKNNSIQVCKDAYFVHLANTKSCQALARLPSFMSIYSGLHGEVVISFQPRWLTIAKASNEESCGTHVLIPVFGGLVELYSSKHIEEDESIIGYVKAQCNNYSDLEMMSTSAISFDGQFIDTLIDKSTNNFRSPLNQSNILAWPQSLIPIAQRNSDSTLDGSSTGSFPSDEGPSPDSNPSSVSQDISLKLQPTCHEDCITPKERVENNKQRPERGQGKSKNLLTERNRRQRINNGILSLRALVPKITKMHKAATLADAIDYIQELNNEIKELQSELKNLNKEDSAEKNTPKLKVFNLDDKIISKPKQANSSLNERPKLEVNVQVSQLGGGNFLLRIACQQRPGVYTKLLEALGYLGLSINEANLTTCDGNISTIFTVQVTENKFLSGTKTCYFTHGPQRSA
ncbi:Transcription factor bHLH90 [Bienertia sinuspersici]